ncbi:MAG: DUF3164 family protein [Flavobacterium lindanitolerans]|uniref:DUF3164 family protein n=1 Tax=Flavobacterium lindanitolerans TaxID=428988 RepID=UPI001A3C4083|nr:DUF3164 family protein [Flavobacterium lindanitolerans]MBL7868854.1 DUF3164 family protein [Flavobacterium lindanitolerans]
MKTEEIEVREAETLGQEKTQVIDLSKMTDEQIESFDRQLAERKKIIENQKKKIKAAFENEKEQFVLETVRQFQVANELLTEMKKVTLEQANTLFAQMFEINGKEAKAQNSFTFKSKDGRMKITVEKQERFEFTTEAIVHITAIREIFRQKFEGRNKGFYNLLDGILMKNTKGDYDAKLLTKAKNQVNQLGDEQLIAEFDKLVDCQQVTGSAMYCRAYVLDDKDKWQDINVQFSSL